MLLFKKHLVLFSSELLFEMWAAELLQKYKVHSKYIKQYCDTQGKLFMKAFLLLMLLCFCLLLWNGHGCKGEPNELNWRLTCVIWLLLSSVFTIFLAAGPQVMWCCRWWWWRWYDIILVIKLQSHCFIATDTCMMMKMMTTANGPEWPDQTWPYTLHTNNNKMFAVILIK